MRIAKFVVTIKKTEDNRLRLIIERDSKTRVIESEPIDWEDTKARRAAIDTLGMVMGFALRQNAFPKDTRVYETITDATGTRTISKGYLEINQKQTSLRKRGR